MNQPVNDSDIIEQIITTLGPLRHEGAEEAVKVSIEMLRREKAKPAINVPAINKNARSMLSALEPLGGNIQIPVNGSDRTVMTLDEFRSGLEIFANTHGPVPRFDHVKNLAATIADGLVNQFSEKPPTTTMGGQVRDIASLLYEAASGEEGAELKHQVDRVHKSWSGLEKFRGR